MGFIDEIKRLARPYEDEEDEEEYDDFDAPAPRSERKENLYNAEPEQRRSNKVVNIHTTTQLQVVLVKPDRFENAAEIADHLREKRTVVLNLEQTNKDIARRLLDFLSGVAGPQSGADQQGHRPPPAGLPLRRGLRQRGQDQEGRYFDLHHHPLQRGHSWRSHRRTGEQRALFLSGLTVVSPEVRRPKRFGAAKTLMPGGFTPPAQMKKSGPPHDARHRVGRTSWAISSTNWRTTGFISERIKRDYKSGE